MIFGRGGEEAAELAAAGVPFEIVPGISSTIGGPCYAGIPVTHRDHNTQLTIFTGHEDPTKGRSDVDWEAIARVGGTIVILMGVGRWPAISERLRAGGLPTGTPAAAVRWGSTARQSTVRATLMQDGVPRLEVLAALGDLVADTEPTITLEPPEIPPPDQCLQRSGAQQGVDLSIIDRLDIRLHPDEALAGSAGRAQVTGWIRLRDGRPPDTLSSLLFADTFPPAVFGLLGVVGWVPTVELTVHVRRRPAPGWMLGRFRTQDLNDGRLIEDGALWDSAGNLVVQSRQLALVRLAERKS